jgi:hypothetical protein
MTEPTTTPPRVNAATILRYQHDERMARATASPHPSYEISRKSPAGKTSGFEFTISHPDPDEAAKLAHKWHEEFPAPEPVAK